MQAPVTQQVLVKHAKIAPPAVIVPRGVEPVAYAVNRQEELNPIKEKSIYEITTPSNRPRFDDSCRQRGPICQWLHSCKWHLCEQLQPL